MIESLLTFLAQTAPTTQEAPGWAKFITQNGILLPMMLVFLVLMFTMSNSKRKQERQRNEMLTQLKKNDEIQTIGGIIGKVLETRDDRVLVKVDENSNTKIWFSRSAIHRVLNQQDKADAK